MYDVLFAHWCQLIISDTFVNGKCFREVDWLITVHDELDNWSQIAGVT